MIRLDKGQNRAFKFSNRLTIGTIPLFWFLSFSFFPFVIHALGWEKKVEFRSFEFTFNDAVVFQIVGFATILIALMILLCYAIKKSKNKVNPTSGYRATESLFNFEDANSVVESIFLYQDYTSDNLYRDLRKDDNANNLLFNMFIVNGWLKFEEDAIKLKMNVDNPYFQKLCVEPLENVLEVFVIEKKILGQPYFSDFPCPSPERFTHLTETVSEDDGKFKIYHTDRILEYSKDIKKSVSRAAHYLTSLKTIADIGIRKFKAEDFERKVEAIRYKYMKLTNDEVIEFTEGKVREKYYSKGNKRLKAYLIQNSAFLGFTLVLYILSFVAVAVCGFQFDIYGNSLYIGLLGGFILSPLTLFISLLFEEASEELNKQGSELIDKIRGLKYFVQNYTQLEHPVHENVLYVWDEFVFFASLFNLNTELYEIAKRNGISYKNEEVLDYFKKVDYSPIVKLNHSVCSGIKFPSIEYGIGRVGEFKPFDGSEEERVESYKRYEKREGLNALPNAPENYWKMEIGS